MVRLKVTLVRIAVNFEPPKIAIEFREKEDGGKLFKSSHTPLYKPSSIYPRKLVLFGIKICSTSAQI